MVSKMIDKRLWAFETPLRQFPILAHDSLRKIDEKKLNMDKLREMEAKEIGNAFRFYAWFARHMAGSKNWVGPSALVENLD